MIRMSILDAIEGSFRVNLASTRIEDDDHEPSITVLELIPVFSDWLRNCVYYGFKNASRNLARPDSFTHQPPSSTPRLPTNLPF